MASAKGLQPCLFLTFTGAPCAQSKCTHSRRPSMAAKCKAVLPWGSLNPKSVWFWRMSADNSLRHSLTSPRKTHSWMGNSSTRCGLGFGPFSSTFSAISNFKLILFLEMSSSSSSTNFSPFKKASKKIKVWYDPRYFKTQIKQKYQLKCQNLPIFEKKKPKYRSIFQHGAIYQIKGNVCLMIGVIIADETLISSKII